jgi:hypothetical protein
MKNWKENEDFLKSVEKPTYKGRYCAIPHDLFIDEINNQLNLKGMIVEDKKYLTSKWIKKQIYNYEEIKNWYEECIKWLPTQNRE